MVLGPVAVVTLREAKGAVSEARRLLRRGIDPIDDRRGIKDATTRTVAVVANCPTTPMRLNLAIAGFRANGGPRWTSRP